MNVAWGNPLVLIGLAGMSVPLLIHMLGRRRATLLRFPTLRFLEVSRLVPVRYTRPTDLALLVLRMIIVGLAAVALAKPYLDTPGRTASPLSAASELVSRVVILDTSASAARDSATQRRLADSVAADADVVQLIRTVDLPSMIPGAASWLSARSGRREIVMVSDFQAGSIDSIDLAIGDTTIGFALIALPRPDDSVTANARTNGAPTAADRRTPSAAGDPAPVGPGSSGTGQPPSDVTGPASQRSPGGSQALPGMTGPVSQRSSGGSQAPPGSSVPAPTVRIIPPSIRPERIAVALRATGVTSAGPSAGLTIRFDTSGSTASERPANRADLARLLVALAGDAELRAAAHDAVIDSTSSAPIEAIPVFRTASGDPVLLAMPEPGPILYLRTDPASLFSAMTIALAAHETSGRAPAWEADTTVIAASRLAAWQRAPVDVRGPASAGPSDARWVWLMVLLLLAAETLLRRTRRREQSSEVSPLPATERAA